jgi:hypothetical protein
MRTQQLDRGPEVVERSVADVAAAVQLGTVEPPLTALEFAAALGEVDEPFEREQLEPFHVAELADSPGQPPTVPPSAAAPYPRDSLGRPIEDGVNGWIDDYAASMPASAQSDESAPPVFSSERPGPRLTWRSRHDERSLAYGIRPRLAGSAPLQDVLLPTGPVLDQLTAGATEREQSCCTGCGLVSAVNTLRLLEGDGELLDLDDAERVYELGQRRDEVPGEQYPGTSVLAALLAARELGLIGGFLWAFGTRDIAQTIIARRLPVVIGVPWPAGLWDAGPGGLVEVTGADEGLGHCLTVNGIKLKGPHGQPGPFFRWQQSSGESYGDGGFGWVHHRDLAMLLRGRGEAAIPLLEAVR